MVYRALYRVSQGRCSYQNALYENIKVEFLDDFICRIRPKKPHIFVIWYELLNLITTHIFVHNSFINLGKYAY